MPAHDVHMPPPISHRERVEQAGRWLDSRLGGGAVPPLVVLIGLGDGFVLDAIARRSPDTRVLALEPDPRHAQRFLSADAWRPWRESGRLVYLTGPDYAGADQAWRIFPAGVTSPAVIPHPELAVGEDAIRAAQTLKRIIHGVAANADARRRFAPAYLVNSLRNLPAIAAGGDVRDLTGAYPGVPAIVLGAGPSLDAAIAWLRTVNNRALIIAADTALRPLLAAGIAPHLVAGLDPGTHNTRHFLSLPECADTWLLAESALDRDATAVFDHRTLWFRAAHHHPWPWFNDLGLDAGQLEVWGSVLTAGFQAARLAGCDPIVMAGADLSYPGGQPYARGTTYEFDWATWVASGFDLNDVWAAALSTESGEEAIDIHGAPIRTTVPMISVRDWLVAQAARSGRRIINASGSGILYGASIEQAALADVLMREMSIATVGNHARPKAGLDALAAAARARDIRSTLQSGERSPVLSQWIDFTCGGFDTNATAAALDSAVSELEAAAGHGGARHAAPASGLPWDRPDLASAMVEIIARLPETIRLGMSSAAPAVAPAPVQRRDIPASRPARLLQAWTLLGFICDQLLGADEDLRARCEPERMDATGINHLFAWPDATQWAVVMLQGLVADAGMPAQADPTFCIRPPLAGLDRGARQPHPLAACACALLAVEWLRGAGAATELCQALSTALKQDASRIVRGEHDATGLAPALTVELVRGSESSTLDVHLSFNSPAIALMRTGTLLPDSPDIASVYAPVTCDLAGVSRLARLDTFANHLASGTAPSPSATRRPLADPPRVSARVLTRGGSLFWSFVSYATTEGVVCITPRAQQSMIVDAAGTVRPHHEWPRGITQELPFGTGGAIAWSNGLAEWPTIRPACVMYRERPGGPVTIEDLPVRSAYGGWWNGRVYWICRSRLEEPQTVVSWAPGEDVRVEASGITPWAVLPEEDALALHPCDFAPSRGYRRMHATTGWKLRPGQPLETVALGPYGAVSSRAARAAWMASAHVDSDVIRLEGPDGRAFSLIAPSPFTIAWAGDSLMAGTWNGEILVFDALLRALGDAS
jgi:hypothetical protein